MTVSSVAGGVFVQNPLMKGRHAPDLSAPFALSQDDRQVLSMRGMSEGQQDAVSSLYAKARAAVQGGQGRGFLASLDTQSLALLQQAASLAVSVNVSTLTEEGAENLLLAPTEAVDLNSDGMIEVGAALTSSFPPVNASPELRAAWEKTASGMNERDAMTLSFKLSGASMSLDGGSIKGRDFSGDFDWNGYMQNLIASNDMSKPYNSLEQYQRINDQLLGFWAALKEQGLA
ncbi:hypothetical protein [Bradyrhizobium sp. BWA-3-5]|uniref:hypothetical protein n=1 Tax=Bradyrhizobium sp. BWA-3-5 TaxID=3080013 RepID=UPI00293E74E2|nr:hypothetical protein [Bradyrhizobium sp. BWA-3-5]WOH69049.1 hypothetical protein RX331_15675 [Bradyrhizobium sp. BWA-3-5]